MLLDPAMVMIRPLAKRYVSSCQSFAVGRDDFDRACLVNAAGEHRRAEAVGAPVGHAAARVIAVGAEPAVDQHFVEWPPGSRAKPHVPIEAGRDRLRFGR